MNEAIGTIIMPDKQMFLENMVNIMSVKAYKDKDKFIMINDSKHIGEALDDYLNSLNKHEYILMFVQDKEPCAQAIRSYAMAREWNEIMVFKDRDYNLRHNMPGFWGFTKYNSELKGYISFIERNKGDIK